MEESDKALAFGSATTSPLLIPEEAFPLSRGPKSIMGIIMGCCCCCCCFMRSLEGMDCVGHHTPAALVCWMVLKLTCSHLIMGAHCCC